MMFYFYIPEGICFAVFVEEQKKKKIQQKEENTAKTAKQIPSGI
jgi:hypothetical protein